MTVVQEKVSPYALTTLARVKERLQILPNDSDVVLTRMINAVSTFIERECGKSGIEKYPNDGHFVLKTYTNEVYSIFGARQKFLVLRNAPVSALTSFQYRAGTPSNPSWTDFQIDQYELDQEGTSGIVRVYGVMPGSYSNMIRASYTSGFVVDWQNFGDYSKHRLPEDLTNTCENIVVRFFKRRQLDGKASETINGATTSWRNSLDGEDQAVLNHYKRFATAF
jgi:hypothetical protein